jgi:hypothetical protein
VTGWDAPAVQQLLKAPGISLPPLKRVNAYVALYPFLEKVILPDGAGDMVQVPANQAIDVRVSRVAREFHKSGRPFLQRYMPFWLAALVKRVLIVLVPLIGLMVPLVRLAPSAYAHHIALVRQRLEEA